MYYHNLNINFNIICKKNILSYNVKERVYLNRLASRSHSSRVRISPCLTGPLTFLTIVRSLSSKNSTRTWHTFPVLPVRPNTLQIEKKENEV